MKRGIYHICLTKTDINSFFFQTWTYTTFKINGQWKKYKYLFTICIHILNYIYYLHFANYNLFNFTLLIFSLNVEPIEENVKVAKYSNILYVQPQKK